MSRLRTRVLTLAAGCALALGLAAPSTAVASPTVGQGPFCGQVWGSLPEEAVVPGADDVVTDVRAGRHVCFDRLVIDLRGPANPTAYDVRYVERVSQQGSGTPVPLRGGAVLQIIVRAPAYDSTGHPTYLPADRAEVVDVRSFDTFEQVAWTGSYEGRTSLGVGVRARLPFRTFVLTGDAGTDQATRLVVDVGHHW